MLSEGLECWDQVTEVWKVDRFDIYGLIMVDTFLNGSYSSRDKIDSINYFNYSPSLVSTSLPCDLAISFTTDDSGISNLMCSSHQNEMGLTVCLAFEALHVSTSSLMLLLQTILGYQEEYNQQWTWAHSLNATQTASLQLAVCMLAGLECPLLVLSSFTNCENLQEIFNDLLEAVELECLVHSITFL